MIREAVESAGEFSFDKCALAQKFGISVET